MYLIEKKSADSLEFLTENTAKIDVQTIENAILEKYNFSLIECSKNSYHADGILRTVFGQTRLLLEKIVLENALDLITSTDISREWLTIRDKFLIATILNIWTDEKKQRILEMMSNMQPLIIAEIVYLSGLSEDAAYEKINELIRDGMLIERGAMFTSDAREIKKYVVVFNNLKYGILNNKIAIRAKLSHGALKASYIIALLQSVKYQKTDEQQKIQLNQHIRFKKATDLI